MKHIICVLIPLIGGLLLIDADRDPMCPFPSNNITFFPDPTNCSQFFECFDGNKYSMHCPENLLWNDILNVCDYASNVDCSTRGPTTTPSGFSPDPRCPYPSDQIIYDINPYHCNMFYQCYQGIRYSMTCPGNLYWNHIRNYCDDLENVDCSRGNSTTTVRPPTAPTGPPTVSCAGLKDGTFLKHPTEPTMFYECVSGKPILFTCPQGTVWNESILSCVHDY